ncbi:MAG: Fic family protein [Kiritimatiellae bacterium]|nr:Fic family protein [Kiritimatiellia bacterium]
MNLFDFNQYYEAVEPGQRERAFAWTTAIGLQDVDGLKPSEYLIKTAKRHIEGEISASDARKLVDAYYEIKGDHDAPSDTEEADKVAARMIAIINTPSFTLSPEYFIGLHAKIFEDVFPHAGRIRDVDLFKREWVLNGDSVQYGAAFMIQESLVGAFHRESKFKYSGLGEDELAEHFAEFIATIWQIHPFREGNTRTTALFAIKYLQAKGFDVANDLFRDKSFYFRNALVRANYEDFRNKIDKTILPLAEFFKVLLFDAEIELRNRYLRVGQEYGTSTAKAIEDMHRADVVVNDVVNVVVTLTQPEEKAAKAILRNGRVSAKELATVIGVLPRQAQRIIASLKVKAGLKRRGSDKSGEWYFDIAN